MKENQGKLSRRTLFAGAGTAGAIATIASVMPTTPTSTAAVQEARPVPTKGGGYHLSEHVKRYFKTTLV